MNDSLESEVNKLLHTTVHTTVQGKDVDTDKQINTV